MAAEPVKLPRRSRRYGVGKEIGGAVYLHRDYEHVIGSLVEEAKKALPTGFEYTVVKYALDTSTVSFIHSPDFDSAPEPAVGDLWTVHQDGRATFRRQPADPYIYHHKWLFVRDDYPRFDVSESHQRSTLWMNLPGIDILRIGKRAYWNREVVPRLAPVPASQGR